MDTESIVTILLIVLLLVAGVFKIIAPRFVFAGLFIFVAFWFIYLYNSLVKLRNRAQEAFSDIDVQLKRRHDLIPNLVETVKGYAREERELFENVTQARARAMGVFSIKERVQAENELSQALFGLFAISERYPELKASVNFLELQRELKDTEDKIGAAREFYNANVRDLNIKVESFPVNLVANFFGFRKVEFFDVEEEKQRITPMLKF